MTVVMAGCGDLGTEAGLRFTEAGRAVLGLRRSPERLPSAITGHAVDLTSQQPEMPPDTEIVVIALTADKRTEDGYRATYLAGVRNTVEALDRARLRPRVLLVSSTAVYGGDEGVIDEDTPTAPATATGSVLVEVERLLHARVPDAVTLRLAGLYGPGRSSLIEQVRHGTAVIPEQPRHTNRIHRDDAASAIVHLSTLADPASVYVGVDDNPAQRSEALRFLADELGVPHPPPATEPTDQSGDKRCRNDRLRSTGFRFSYPSYRDGYRAVLSGQGSRHS